MAEGRGRQRPEGRAALRARHRQGDPGGRGRSLRRAAQDCGRLRRGSGRPDGRGDRRGRRAGDDRGSVHAVCGRSRSAAGAGRGCSHRGACGCDRSRERRQDQGFPTRATDGSRARSRPCESARHGPGRPDRRRGRRGRTGDGCHADGRARPDRRGRVGAADKRPQDDRAPPDRGVDGAGLRTDCFRRDGARERPRPARPRARPRRARDRHRPAGEGQRTGARPSPRRQRAVHGRGAACASPRRTSASPSRRRRGS